MSRARALEARSVLTLAKTWTRCQQHSILSAAEIWNLTLLSTCNLVSYDELADIRGVSPPTIRAQMNSVRLKLNARSDLFAVAEALRRGIIPRIDPRRPGTAHADILAFPGGRNREPG